MSILRQQYRRFPSSSSTLMGLSPALTLRLKVSHLSAISLPQVKHLTGMIIFFLPACTISVFFAVRLARRTSWVRLLVDPQLTLLCRRQWNSFLAHSSSSTSQVIVRLLPCPLSLAP